MTDDGGDLSVIKAFHNAGADSLQCLRLFSRSGANNNSAVGCYILGVWAGIAAREYIKSTTVLKKWADNTNTSDSNNSVKDNKVDVVVINDALCREMIRDCLLRRGVSVEYYEKSLSPNNNNNNSSYVCIQRGSPGNIADFETTLFAFDEAEIQLMATGAIVLHNPHLSIHTKTSPFRTSSTIDNTNNTNSNSDATGGIRVGFACLNTTLRQFSVAEFLDNIQLNSLDALITQTNLKELTLCTIASNRKKRARKGKKNETTSVSPRRSSSANSSYTNNNKTNVQQNLSEKLEEEEEEEEQEDEDEEEEEESEIAMSEIDPEVEQEQTIRRICERANVKLHLVQLGKSGTFIASHNPTLAATATPSSTTTTQPSSSSSSPLQSNLFHSFTSVSSIDVLRELLRVPEERLALLELPLASRALEVVLSLIDVLDPIHRRAYYLRHVIPQTFMSLDNAAIEALHIISHRPENKSSLPTSVYAWLNRCFTGMGSRAMRQWLLQPLRNVDDIHQRLTMVEVLVENPLIRDVLISNVLKPCHDMDRLNRKLQRRHIQLKETQHFLTFVAIIAEAITTLQMYTGQGTKLVCDEYVAPLEDLHAHMTNLKTLIEVTVDVTDRYHARINHGFDDQLQELHEQLRHIQDAIHSEHERVLRTYDWNEKQLKCEFHHIYGYVFRVSRKEDRQLRNNNNNNSSSKVFHTLQTAKDGVRFVTDTLASLSDRYKRLSDEYDTRQQKLKMKLIDTIASYLPVLDDAKEIIAALDVFVAWALVISSAPRGMVKPTLLESVSDNSRAGDSTNTKNSKSSYEEWYDNIEDDDREETKQQEIEKNESKEDMICVTVQKDKKRMCTSGKYGNRDIISSNNNNKNRSRDEIIIELKNVRHPLVELRQHEKYVANSVQLTSRHNGLVITGPNMGGKSTFMRSVGIAVVLAQVGCYIPADAAIIRVRDAIKCRVGATDHLAQGVSTFMVEMLESAAIINTATHETLAIIDELGRGTSTYDGFGLAWAIAKEIAVHLRSTLLFSTHFHELTQLAHEYDNVQNVHFGANVNESAGTLQFSYSLSPGPCGRSYGLYVASLAHMPDEVVARAKLKAAELENFESEFELSKNLSALITSDSDNNNNSNDNNDENNEEEVEQRQGANDKAKEEMRKLHERVVQYAYQIKNIECMEESPERETQRRALQEQIKRDEALQKVLQGSL